MRQPISNKSAWNGYLREKVCKTLGFQTEQKRKKIAAAGNDSYLELIKIKPTRAVSQLMRSCKRAVAGQYSLNYSQNNMLHTAIGQQKYYRKWPHALLKLP